MKERVSEFFVAEEELRELLERFFKACRQKPTPPYTVTLETEEGTELTILDVRE